MRARRACRRRERLAAACEPEENLHVVGEKARFLQIDLEPGCALSCQPWVEPARRAARTCRKNPTRNAAGGSGRSPASHPGQTARPLSARDRSVAPTLLPSGNAASAPPRRHARGADAAPSSLRAMGSASYAACCRITRDRVATSPAIPPRAPGAGAVPRWRQAFGTDVATNEMLRGRTCLLALSSCPFREALVGMQRRGRKKKRGKSIPGPPPHLW